MTTYSDPKQNVKPANSDSCTGYVQVTETDIEQAMETLASLGLSVTPEALLASIAHVSQFTEEEVEQQVHAAQRIVQSEVLTIEEQMNLLRQVMQIPSQNEGV